MDIKTKLTALSLCLLYSVPAMAADESLQNRVDQMSEEIEAQQKSLTSQKREMLLLRREVQGASRLAKLASRISWDGFLSAGVATVDVGEQVQWGNDGPDNELDWNSDTMFALQARIKVTDKLQVVSQMMSKGGFNSEFDADWFYLQYTPNDNFNLMLGRIRPQYFMLSDYVEVGFAYPWIRPPEEVYDPIPTDWGQGISFNFNWEGPGESLHNATLQVMQNEDQGTVSRFDMSLLGAMYEFNYGPLTLALRGGDLKADIFLESDSFRSASTALESFDEDISILPNEDADASYLNVGIRYETLGWLFLSEWATFDTQGLFVDTEGYYATIGKRFGVWMPHLTFAHHESTDDDVREDPRILEALGASAGAGIQSVSQMLWNQQNDSYTLGLHYTFNSNTVIKFEVKQITERDGTVAQFQKSATTNSTAPTIIPDKEDILVYGIVVDMVF